MDRFKWQEAQKKKKHISLIGNPKEKDPRPVLLEQTPYFSIYSVGRDKEIRWKVNNKYQLEENFKQTDVRAFIREHAAICFKEMVSFDDLTYIDVEGIYALSKLWYLDTHSSLVRVKLTEAERTLRLLLKRSRQ